MPKALVLDDDRKPRRGRAQKADISFDVERNLVLRVLLHSPWDTFAGGVALAGVIAIMFNAMFMQAGHHPAPMFSAVFPETATVSAPLPDSMPSGSAARPRATSDQRPAEIKPEPTPGLKAPASQGMGVAAMRPPAPIPAHNDPVGDIIQSNRRVAAVQRALTDFGYGQLKPTGVAGADTLAAAQKFERDHKLPVSNQISDRMVRELSAVTGRTIE